MVTGLETVNDLLSHLIEKYEREILDHRKIAQDNYETMPEVYYIHTGKAEELKEIVMDLKNIKAGDYVV